MFARLINREVKAGSINTFQVLFEGSYRLRQHNEGPPACSVIRGGGPAPASEHRKPLLYPTVIDLLLFTRNIYLDISNIRAIKNSTSYKNKRSKGGSYGRKRV